MIKIFVAPLFNPQRMAFLHVIAVSHRRYGELKVFIQSWINQTSNNWLLTVIHDGLSEEFDCIMKSYEDGCEAINHRCTKKRYNDFGHSLRDLGLKDLDGRYVLLTNCDNYFVPGQMNSENAERQFLSQNIVPDVMIFDMVHSHVNPGGRPGGPYTFFEVSYKPFSIDVSAAVVRSELAKSVGFRDKSHDGDQTYFKDLACKKNDLSIIKLSNILFVHN